MPNRLVHEKSPYLQQHAHNPVDWYPWGPEAFEKARREDKPIFLSIGYSTCHWCHVMEHESFESPAIAEMINRWFVPIKVDREERPDIDRIYMAYVQAATGGGGWPMSVWLTPDLNPFVGGTYFPPENRYGRAGFPLVLERIAEAWKNERGRILESSASVMQQLREHTGARGAGADSISLAALDSAFNQFRRLFDPKLGGFGAAPKFPRPSIHNFLLRLWKRTGNADALNMTVETLLAMEKGGMHDQLGGGFHRYSVDEYWFVPHFEKMLYDQAQLAISYLEAYQITRNETFARAAQRILDYVLREMASPQGAFYSAEDADSAPDAAHPEHKSEGAFYVWTWREVEALLGEERTLCFAFRYGIERGGNVANDPQGEFTQKNILFQAHTAAETAHHFERTLDEVGRVLAECGRILFEARAKRPRPHLDDKILTAWNGLMISALARGAAILNRPAYAQSARRAADFIGSFLRGDNGSVLRRFRDGDAAIEGMLDDYAFFAQGLLDLYETTFDPKYLSEAVSLTCRQRELFEDPAGGFYSTAHEDAMRLMRLKEDHDGAEPSGNSVALMTLLRLHRMTGDDAFDKSARRLIAAFQPVVSAAPSAMPQLLAAAEFDLAPPREIVIAGRPDGPLTRVLWEGFDPNRVLLRVSPEVTKFRPETAGMAAHGAEAAVFICQNFTCQAPVTNEKELRGLLN